LKLKGTEPDAKELNKELSRARAEEVIGLLKKYTEGRSVDGGNVKNILYLYEGKGDSFPDPKNADYKVDDKRRRVVLLFWGLFPE
jgi:flagellar motor protein MotB